LNVDNSLTLVVAAAGYGKSVTISQWLDHKGSKYGWISLDNDCNDLRVFLDYLVSCIQITYPDSLGDIQDLVNSMDIPPVKVISDLFVNEIMNLEEEFVLVLDDYHLINNQQIHALLSEILKYPSPKLKIVLLSRKDPPLMLSSMKAYGKVNEIRMTNLRFNEKEVISLANNISAQPFSFDTATELVKVTEGWIIGLRLAIQSVIQGRDLKIVKSEMSNDRMLIAQFLTDEILLPQSQYIRDCLYKATVLDRFCEGLLISVCTNDEIQDGKVNDIRIGFFAEITKKTLFIIPLDSDQTWFRFHHLFREILKKQMDEKYTADQISALHRNAARWLEMNGYSNEAMNHAILSGDDEFVNQIFENHFQELLDNERLPVLERWVKSMPREVLRKHITPNLVRAFLCDAKQEFNEMEKVLNRTLELLKPLSRENSQNKIKWGNFYAIQAIFFYLTGRIHESLSSSTQAIDLLDNEVSFLKDAAILYHAFALIALGKRKEAEKKVIHYRNALPSDDQLALVRSSIVEAMVFFLAGDLPHIYKSIHSIIDFYKGKSFLTTRSMAIHYVGIVYYQWNQLDEAIPWLKDSWDHRFSGRPYWVIHNLFIRALILYAKNEKTELNQLFEQAHKYADEIEMPDLHPSIAAMEVEISLRDDDFERIQQFHHKSTYDFIPPLFYYYIPQLTRIRFRLKEGGRENLETAYHELKELIDFGRSTSNVNVLIQTLPTMAILHHQQGKNQEALKSLSEALNLAKPGGILRVFVDMGEEIRDLILLLKNKSAQDPFVNRILEAFALHQSVKNHEPEQDKIINDSTLIETNETLSAKEIEILKLVALGLQNKEIAEKLFLSPNSIKKYLYDIYQKLEVNSRTHAINKAIQLNLI